MQPVITLIDTYDPEAEIGIRKPLTEFNFMKTRTALAYRPLILTVTDPQSKVVMGGLVAETYYSYLCINTLFIPEHLRGVGTGSALLSEAEKEAIARGCSGAWVDTYDWQARTFYERLGYHIFGQLEGYPPGHTRFFLTKRLSL